MPHWIEAVAWCASWPFRRLWIRLDDWALEDWAGAVAGDEDGPGPGADLGAPELDGHRP